MTPRFCIITPDRNDRHELLNFCKQQVSRFHFEAKHFIVNYRAETEECDLVPRVRKGIAMAKAEGFEWVLMVENDDFYPSDYLDRIIPYMETHDFIGDQKSIYYNLRNRTFSELNHRGRASLFTTSFRISALEGFRFPPDHSPFLDIPLWEFASKKRRKFVDTGAIGIKHGTGKTGGKGHRMTGRNSDQELKWLESHVDSEAFEFYKSLQF